MDNMLKTLPAIFRRAEFFSKTRLPALTIPLSIYYGICNTIADAVIFTQA